jgi:thiol-disulfide isomerase/thioredoxin
MISILKQSISEGYSYNQYRKLATDLLLQGKTTGTIQTPDLVNYTKLNETRMNRLDKTMILTDEVIDFLNQLEKEFVWLVLTESWCGDAAQIVPILNKMASVTNKIDLKIVLRDEQEALMNLFLTNGTKSIPKLIIIEKETMEVIGDFGPRPQVAASLVKNYKEQHGKVDETLKTALQKWYFDDKGVSTQNEVIDLMK